MDEHLKPALRAAIETLEHNGYRYAVIGGIALAQWNVARYTHDVDLKVLVPDTDYGAAQKLLRRTFPLRARPQLPENTLIVDVNVNGVIVDFLLALPGYEEMIIERATQRDLGGFNAWICSAEDLIIQKVVANRSKDWLDVESLIKIQHKKIDHSYIENWLQQFSEVLEQPELLTNYHRLLAKAKSQNA